MARGVGAPLVRGPGPGGIVGPGGYQFSTGPLALDLFSGGTFTRSSEGSYLIAAPSDGSTAFLAWVANDIRRISNRGDGLGDMLLLEGSRTNELLQSEDFATTWSPASLSGSIVTDTYAAPDGVMDADGVPFSASINARVTQSVSGSDAWTDGEAFAYSCWMRDPVGVGTTGSARLLLVDKTLATALDANTGAWEASPSVWRYISGTGNIGTGANPIAAQVRNANTHGAALAYTLAAWGAQYERGAYWPSSYIRTTTGSATRAAEVLTYAAGEYPSSFLSTGFTFSFAPDFSNTEMISTGTTDICLLNIDSGGTNRQVKLDYLAGSIYGAFISPGGSTIVQGPITWSRGQLLTFSVVPSTATITVSGATTGNGTNSGSGGGTYPSGAIRVGSYVSGALNPFFGRMGRYLTAL